ncbi:MAG: GAF domain-containing protein, partial [Pseudonocardia sp.]|nr:GAF domain-containing protein [Pseudonocardia sp.]
VLEVGRANPQLLRPPLVETEMVRRKRAVLVDHVQDRSDVYAAISRASRSRSYCAAPVSVHGSVAGFLHVDCFLQRRDVDESDRQVLAMFAEGLGQALSRTLVLDRLEALRAELDRLSGQVAAASGGLDGEVGWGVPVGAEPARAGGGIASFPRSAPAGAVLTGREVEVLRLMAAGDTNARIARRLVISEGTVKSHVKHILRKLGAANRAEAVSHWLHMTHGAAPERRHATVARG